MKKMFDYAALISILEKHLDPESDITVYVCANELSKGRFKRGHKDLQKAIVLTVDDIWVRNRLFGTKYKDYKIIM